MTTEWDSLAEWWVGEVAADPAYAETVLPMAERLCPPGLILEVGCGEGQVLRKLADPSRTIIGLEPNPVLARAASEHAPVVRAQLPDTRSIRPGTFDGAVVVLVLEHIEHLPPVFAALARIVRRGGTLGAVINHPVVTAPGAAAVVDPRDGELFWRWGSYLESGATVEPAGDTEVTFFHRPLSAILNSAAGAGWSLEKAEEVAWPIDEGTAAPRLIGLGWRNRLGS